MAVPRPRPRLLADALGLVALALAFLALVAGLASGLGWVGLVDGFVVSNTLVGLVLAIVGYLIARQQSGNAVGWLLLAGGLAYLVSAAGYAVLAWATEPGDETAAWRLVADVVSVAWPVAVGFCIPMSLLVFPDGRLLGPRWRYVMAASAVGTFGFVAMLTLGSQDTTSSLGVEGYLRLGDSAVVGAIAAPSTALVAVGYIGCVVALILRYRRGDDRHRRQVLWVVLSAMLMVVVSVLSAAFGWDSWASIVVLVLPAVAILVAILRYQLLDIRLVVSRSLAYLLLTGLLLLLYSAVVLIAGRFLTEQVPFSGPVLAILVVALVFSPLRQFLQSRVDRLFYGSRSDQVRAFSAVGERLGEAGVQGSAGLEEMLAALCDVLRLPWAEIRDGDRLLASRGVREGEGESLELRLGGDVVACLEVGPRRGQSRLDSADRRIIDLVSVSMAVAVQATQLATDLDHARQQLVLAREEERRRLGSDLHDGIGPMLTGIALQAEAARRLSETDPEGASRLMAQVKDNTTAAIADVRRLVAELRPAVLDALGLVRAIEEYGASLHPLEVSVEAGDMPALAPAVEVAAYRISTEGLNNVARHAQAEHALVSLCVEDGRLIIRIADDGPASSVPWQPGVGLSSMRDRAEELGGTFTAGLAARGGRVEVALPVGSGG
jgi:two-component system NarL family sensor kinase